VARARTDEEIPNEGLQSQGFSEARAFSCNERRSDKRDGSCINFLVKIRADPRRVFASTSSRFGDCVSDARAASSRYELIDPARPRSGLSTRDSSGEFQAR